MVENTIVELMNAALYDKALFLIDSVPLTFQSASIIYPYKGYIFYLSGRCRDGINVLENLIKKYPPNTRAKKFLYMIFLDMEDFESSLNMVKECWESGDYERSTFIYLLAYMLILKQFEMLDSICKHVDEPVLLSLGYIYCDKFERAVELMKFIDDSNPEKIYLRALISAFTESECLLDYATYLDEDFLIEVIRKTKDKHKMFRNIATRGCCPMNRKALRIAKEILTKNEYEILFGNAHCCMAVCEMKNSCTKMNSLVKCRATCDEDSARIEKRITRRQECGLYGSDANERYSKLMKVSEDLKAGLYDNGISKLKEIYGVKTDSDLRRHLVEKQNIQMLNEIAASHVCNNREEESLKYFASCVFVYSSYVKDKVNFLVRLIDGYRIKEIIDLLRFCPFDKEYFRIENFIIQKKSIQLGGCEEVNKAWNMIKSHELLFKKSRAHSSAEP